MKTIEEINEKIKQGRAVVVNAAEMVDLVREKGTKAAAEQIDVVTTGTFGPMCSSGMFMNLGHSKPRIKLGGGTCYLNDVPCYTGLAAVDIYVGATAIPDDDPRNQVYPGRFEYGGGHVIEDFVAGKELRLRATAYGTDCYPRKRLETVISKETVNEAYLFNPRNSYQNYNVAVNLSDRMIYTYMGALKPKGGNANYCSAGQLSPLLKDPLYKTIGIGSRIFLGGGIGYVTWQGTQHNPDVLRSEDGVPRAPGGTLAVTGDAKQMNPRFVTGASFTGYGTTLAIGVGVPIPVLSEEIVYFTSRSDSDLVAQVVDYSSDYPNRIARSLGEVSYARLKTGKISLNGQDIRTFPISSYSKGLEIANILKDWIGSGRFTLSNPVASLPTAGSGIVMKPLEETQPPKEASLAAN